MKKAVFSVFAFSLVLALAARPSVGQEKVRIATASMTSPSVAYLLVGLREGFFKDEG